MKFIKHPIRHHLVTYYKANEPQKYILLELVKIINF